MHGRVLLMLIYMLAIFQNTVYKEMVEFWLLHNKKLCDYYMSRIISVSRMVTS
jgi:hypothetical protein